MKADKKKSLLILSSIISVIVIIGGFVVNKDKGLYNKLDWWLKIISPIFMFEYKNGAITSIIISYQTK